MELRYQKFKSDSVLQYRILTWTALARIGRPIALFRNLAFTIWFSLLPDNTLWTRCSLMPSNRCRRRYFNFLAPTPLQCINSFSMTSRSALVFSTSLSLKQSNFFPLTLWTLNASLFLQNLTHAAFCALVLSLTGTSKLSSHSLYSVS